jgi:hypothetical protein
VTAIQVAAMPKERERRGETSSLELNFGAGCEVSAASFVPQGDGGTFACSVGPLSDETVAALDRAAHSHTPVRLLFPGDQSVALELVKLERKGPQLIRISGRVRRAADDA